MWTKNITWTLVIWFSFGDVLFWIFRNNQHTKKFISFFLSFFSWLKCILMPTYTEASFWWLVVKDGANYYLECMVTCIFSNHVRTIQCESQRRKNLNYDQQKFSFRFKTELVLILFVLYFHWRLIYFSQTKFLAISLNRIELNGNFLKI